MMSRNRKIGILLTVCLLTVGVASVYAASGTNPFDAIGTQFDTVLTDLANMWDRILGLEADITAIEEQMYLHLEITELKTRVAALEAAPPGGGTQGPEGPEGPAGPKGDTGEQGPIGPTGALGAPSHDSRWQDAWNQIQMEFWFSTEDVPDYKNAFVYMELMKGGEVIHNIGYGGLGTDIPYPSEGIYWEMNDNLVKVYLSPSHLYDYVRIRIWQLPLPP